MYKSAKSEGLTWHNCEWSQWCFDNKVAILDTEFTVEDALVHLKTLADDSYDVIFSENALVCWDDTELTELITEMNRVGKLQIHLLNMTGNTLYYYIRTTEQWLAFPFATGTIIYNASKIRDKGAEERHVVG